jgi:hypothetical protein
VVLYARRVAWILARRGVRIVITGIQGVGAAVERAPERS